MKANVMRANTKSQRTTTRRGLRGLTVVGAAVAVLVTGSCGGNETAPPTSKAAPSDAIHNQKTGANPQAAAPAVFAEDAYLKNAGEYIDAAKETWDAKAATVRVELKEMSFTPKDLTLAAGKPYVIELVNNGNKKHEFAASKFFRSAAVRKVDTPSSEVKAAFFTEIEVLAGKTVKLFVIPVTPGSFEMLCEMVGHREAGMEGTITVTGAKPATPVEVLGSMKGGPWLQEGPALVKAALETWGAKAVKVKIEAGENGAKMFFKPTNLVLKAGTPYEIELVNTGKEKHEYAAEKLFPTMALRKAQDAFGEYTVVLLKEAEVKPGQKLELFVIPTKPGTFKIVCAIPGHEKAGMVGTVTVTK